MSPEDIKKLLGGYATGTLTAGEQQALFAAALEDQELFDALAREQSLRDLLRDPAARAELLSALDTPTSQPGGFWQWLRRPLVAGLATAGVAAIAIVGVWQGTRVAGVKPAEPVIVADLRRQEQEPALSPAQPPTPPREVDASMRAKIAEAPRAFRADEKAAPLMPPPLAKERTQVARAPGAVRADKKEAPLVARAPPPPPDPAAVSTLNGRQGDALPPATPPPPAARRAEADTIAPAMTPPPAPSASSPAVMARKAETESSALGQSAGAVAGAVKENVTLDARALFYAGQLAPGVNAPVQPSGSGRAAPPPARAETSPADASRTATVTGSGVTARTATAPHLGVRVSILRGENEVDLTTVLDPGETVRLRLIPNADGFLYVTEGTRTVATGEARRLKPFETPELRFEGSGQKQLYITVSRNPRTLAPPSLGNLGRGNMVEASADQGRATYVVSGPREAGAQQVIVPVTLTYRQ